MAARRSAVQRGFGGFVVGLSFVFGFGFGFGFSLLARAGDAIRQIDSLTFTPGLILLMLGGTSQGGSLSMTGGPEGSGMPVSSSRRKEGEWRARAFKARPKNVR